MPADRLNPTRNGRHNSNTTPTETEQAILDVLTGTPLDDAAARARMEPTDLDAAARIYQHAGRRALQQATDPTWWQIYLQFTDWDSAEQTAAEHLAPLLNDAGTGGPISAWWFIRKRPCWRLRIRLNPRSHATTRVSTALDRLTAAGRIQRWWTGIYEPETPPSAALTA